QHQELFFTDLKYSLAVNPLFPAYNDECAAPAANGVLAATHWARFDGGLIEIGADASAFHFDNETPRHRVYLEPFELATRLVSNAEFQHFIDEGGYGRPDLWLSDGWAAVQEQGWQAPQYWHQVDGEAHEYTLRGLQPQSPAAPVCHISYYEADAYARFAGARLPTEAEWEHAARKAGHSDAERADSTLHPEVANGSAGLQQLYGHCWQWTQSAYAPYPGFCVGPGAIGEYNGKFMSNQYVLRGSSCVTQPGQGRDSYRNFFYPQDRWQFSGIRLARST
ncbi:MAG: ergothioneine biosynthesis protein EgtB, partial [Pseudomonadota bacterium]